VFVSLVRFSKAQLAHLLDECHLCVEFKAVLFLGLAFGTKSIAIHAVSHTHALLADTTMRADNVATRVTRGAVGAAHLDACQRQKADAKS